MILVITDDKNFSEINGFTSSPVSPRRAKTPGEKKYERRTWTGHLLRLPLYTIQNILVKLVILVKALFLLQNLLPDHHQLAFQFTSSARSTYQVRPGVDPALRSACRPPPSGVADGAGWESDRD